MTERLRLEPIRASDGGSLFELHQDPGIAAWYGGRWSRRQADQFAVDSAERWHRDGAGKWLAYRRTDGRLVGRGGLSCVDLLGAPRLEVGWALRQDLWGQGFATEMGRAALDLAFHDLGAAEVVAFTEVHNVGSRRVMERLGMSFWRVVHRPGLVAGSSGVHARAPFALYRIAAHASDEAIGDSLL